MGKGDEQSSSHDDGASHRAIEDPESESTFVTEQSRLLERPLVRRFRVLCLDLPRTTETLSWGHPNFKAGGRTFATFEVVQGRPSFAFRLDAKDAALLRRRKDAFETPYGRGKWISLWADRRVNWRFVERLVRRSYQTVVLPIRRSRPRISKGAQRAPNQP